MVAAFAGTMERTIAAARRAKPLARSIAISRGRRKDVLLTGVIRRELRRHPPLSARCPQVPSPLGPQTLEPHAEGLVEPPILDQPRCRLVGDDLSAGQQHDALEAAEGEVEI